MSSPPQAPTHPGQATAPTETPVEALVERVMPAHEAEQRALVAAHQLGLRPRVRRLGRHGGMSSWTCELLDAAGHRVPNGLGCGKGGDQDARVGAVSEAVEHYLTGPALFDPDQVVFHDGRDLAAGMLSGEACVPVLARMPRVACQLYAPLANNTRPQLEPPPLPGSLPVPLAVPLALGTSWYLDAPHCRDAVADTTDYRELTRYGTNHGSAIGTTRDEALLHGMNEIIERDALSLLLARCFLTDHYRPQAVDPASLPDQLAAALRAAEQVVGGPVWLLHATTDIGVPTFFAYTTHCSYPEGRFGCGTSLHPRYAAWQAVSELVQTRLAADACDEDITVPSMAALAPYPRLRACGEGDLTEPLHRAQWIEFPDHDHAPRDVPTQSACRCRSIGRSWIPALLPRGRRPTGKHGGAPRVRPRTRTVHERAVRIPGAARTPHPRHPRPGHHAITDPLRRARRLVGYYWRDETFLTHPYPHGEPIALSQRDITPASTCSAAASPFGLQGWPHPAVPALVGR